MVKGPKSWSGVKPVKLSDGSIEYINAGFQRKDILFKMQYKDMSPQQRAQLGRYHGYKDETLGGLAVVGLEGDDTNLYRKKKEGRYNDVLSTIPNIDDLTKDMKPSNFKQSLITSAIKHGLAHDVELMNKLKSLDEKYLREMFQIDRSWMEKVYLYEPFSQYIPDEIRERQKRKDIEDFLEGLEEYIQTRERIHGKAM